MRSALFFILLILPLAVYAKTSEAIFAGGCFWCMEADFDKLTGVTKTISGYDGGESKSPSYEQVSSGTTNYVESVKVTYDPDIISYKDLVDYFWHHIDPTTKDAQFCDHGRQYRSVIFYLDNNQKKIALESLAEIKKKLPVVYTEVTPSTHFYPAEEYHQNYYVNNPVRYQYYRWRCGRDARVKEIWNDKN